MAAARRAWMWGWAARKAVGERRRVSGREGRVMRVVGGSGCFGVDMVVVVEAAGKFSID